MVQNGRISDFLQVTLVLYAHLLSFTLNYLMRSWFPFHWLRMIHRGISGTHAAGNPGNVQLQQYSSNKKLTTSDH